MLVADTLDEIAQLLGFRDATVWIAQSKLQYTLHARSLKEIC